MFFSTEDALDICVQGDLTHVLVLRPALAVLTFDAHGVQRGGWAIVRALCGWMRVKRIAAARSLVFVATCCEIQVCRGRDGSIVRRWGSHGQFGEICGLSVCQNGTLFVADFSRVQAFGLDGSYRFSVPCAPNTGLACNAEEIFVLTNDSRVHVHSVHDGTWLRDFVTDLVRSLPSLIKITERGSLLALSPWSNWYSNGRVLVTLDGSDLKQDDDQGTQIHTLLRSR